MMIELLNDNYKSETYSKSIARLVGSMVGATLLQSIVRKWENRERGKAAIFWFFKPEVSSYYHKGRSWEEELGTSLEDIKYGLSYISTRVKDPNSVESMAILNDTRPDFDIKGRLINSSHLVVWWRDRQKRIWFALNKELLEAALIQQANGDWKNSIAPLTEGFRELEKQRMTEEQGAAISSFGALDILVDAPDGEL
jgi:hypothetical protein